MKKYIDRLASEWEQHGNIIIAVDFDDTIAPWKLNDKQECNKVIAILKDCSLVGAYISIFTACNEDRFGEIRGYCTENELVISSINSNPIELPYGNRNKIYANIFIDDRAGLGESLEILKEAMYIQRSKIASKKLTDQTSGF